LKYALISIISYNINLRFVYKSIENITIGDIVLIELKNNKTWGIIIEIVNQPQNYIIFEHILYKKIINQLLYYTKKNNQELIASKKEEILLNDEQEKIVHDIINTFNNNTIQKPVVLQGVTGSGKTYIYIKIIEYFLYKNQSIIFLFPNANLAHTICQEIKLYINQDICYEYHSHGTKDLRINTWQALLEKRPIVVCGVHLPLFLPIQNLGTIIIDEEHDLGYADNRHPYINTKEAALLRAYIENIPIILGSATPSLSTIYNIKNNKYIMFQLKKRHFNTNLPKMSIININKDEKKIGISIQLKNAILQTLEQKEQILLFLNKKGIYRYAECKKCKYKFSCIHCNILLTIYAHHIAQCNRCKYKIILPEQCPICHHDNKIKTVGYGLNKLAQYIETIFPQAKIILLDGDILKNKKISETILSDINNKKYDIILGTQVITKGYNFNNVSLVGVINADQIFSIPHFMIMEETIQQYIQVAGRAGRQNGKGTVLLQTISDINYLENYIKEENYFQFSEFELNFRCTLNLPPYCKMSLILIKHENDTIACELIQEIYKKIIYQNESFINSKTLTILAPEKTFLNKIKNKYYYQITIKSSSFNIIQIAIKNIINDYNHKKNILCYIPNPILNEYE
jgi:primosomal protein N' (replication factor Y)